MNNTTYKPRPILSPIQPKIKPVVNAKNDRHPIYEEINKLCHSTNYNINVSFEEDIEALDSFSIPGLVAVKCTLRTHGQIIAFGRSCSVLGKMNRYVDRVISGLIGGSFLSAANNAMKVLETLRMSEVEENINSLNKNSMNTQTAVADFDGSRRGFYFGEDSVEEPEMTSKQRDFLNQLILNIDNPDTREEYLSQVNGGLSRADASELISSLLPMK
jgi:hypothetical protein